MLFTSDILAFLNLPSRFLLPHTSGGVGQVKVSRSESCAGTQEWLGAVLGLRLEELDLCWGTVHTSSAEGLGC